MQERKKGFIIHENFYEQVCMLSMEERGMLLSAMFEYHRENKTTQGMSPLCAMAFTGIRQAMDQDRISYEKRCAAARTNGKKGGRPKKEPAPSVSEKPKKADMDMDMDMEMDIDMDMDMDMEMAMDMDMEPKTPSDPDLSEPLREELSEPSADCLSEKQKEDLKKLGVPNEYVAEREERVCLFAKANGRDPADVLLSWWVKDQPRSGRGRSRPPKQSLDREKSYDLDEFFESALKRGMRMLN